MTLCEWCGDENVSPMDVYFAEKRGGVPVVYRKYMCDICNMEFLEEITDEVSTADRARLDNQRRSD